MYVCIIVLVLPSLTVCNTLHAVYSQSSLYKSMCSIYIYMHSSQRNCLYFALNAKPICQYEPRFKLHRKFREKMLPLVNHSISNFIIVSALVLNCILLSLEVCRVYTCMYILYWWVGDSLKMVDEF